jgi:hypothetical protein
MCKATYFAALLLGLGVLMQRLIAMDGNLNNMDVVFGAALIPCPPVNQKNKQAHSF